MLERAPIIQALGPYLLVQGPGQCLKGREQTGCALLHVSTTVTRLIRHYWPKCQEFDGCIEPGTHQCRAGKLVCCKHAHRFGWLHTLHVPDYGDTCLCGLHPKAIERGVASVNAFIGHRAYGMWKLNVGQLLLSMDEIKLAIHLATKRENWDAITVHVSDMWFAMPMDGCYVPWDYPQYSEMMEGIFGWGRIALIMHFIVPLKRYMIACHQKRGDQFKPYDQRKDESAMEEYFYKRPKK